MRVEAPGATEAQTETQRLASLANTDHFCPLEEPHYDMRRFNAAQHFALMEEFTPLRQSGRLLTCAAKIRCPVVAIHGREDPHPWQGVAQPLQNRLAHFNMVVLEQCGHEPWREKYAKDQFYKIMRRELAKD